MLRFCLGAGRVEADGVERVPAPSYVHSPRAKNKKLELYNFFLMIRSTLLPPVSWPPFSSPSAMKACAGDPGDVPENDWKPPEFLLSNTSLAGATTYGDTRRLTPGSQSLASPAADAVLVGKARELTAVRAKAI